ncbi:hypothetical protein ATCC90586_001003 [Pythium insidiosum]|nr:hypothetical protein ATCC90586_001003 [Pythium insidiosum]
MLCSISGQVPVEPVVSVKSGHVFEKRLVLQYLAQNQSRCPVTQDELDAEKDLLPLIVAPPTASKAPTNLTTFSPEAASIPQLLSLFQNEWDAVMLETFTLKKHLEKTRQELSHALYQHDAACRVIARLNSENAALRERLATRSTAAGQDDVDMEAPTKDGLSVEAIATIDAKQKALAKERKEFKKKEAPVRAARLDGLASSWAVASSHTLHDSEKPGVLSVAVDPKDAHRVVTTGVDKQVKIFNVKTQQLSATLDGHSKKVNKAAFHPSADLLVSASHDKTVKVWSATPTQQYSAVHSLSFHGDAVVDTSIHATGDYFISASLDATWGFADIRSGMLVARRYLNGERDDLKLANASNEALCVAFHPDGGIFGTGAKNKLVQMWDVKSMENVLATGSHDGTINIWDLRKLKSIFELNLSKMGPINDVTFDPSGQFLAVAGANVRVLKEVGKTDWEVVKTFDAHKAAVTGAEVAIDQTLNDPTIAATPHPLLQDPRAIALPLDRVLECPIVGTDTDVLVEALLRQAPTHSSESIGPSSRLSPKAALALRPSQRPAKAPRKNAQRRAAPDGLTITPLLSNEMRDRLQQHLQDKIQGNHWQNEVRSRLARPLSATTFCHRDERLDHPLAARRLDVGSSTLQLYPYSVEAHASAAAVARVYRRHRFRQDVLARAREFAVRVRFFRRVVKPQLVLAHRRRRAAAVHIQRRFRCYLHWRRHVLRPFVERYVEATLRQCVRRLAAQRVIIVILRHRLATRRAHEAHVRRREQVVRRWVAKTRVCLFVHLVWCARWLRQQREVNLQRLREEIAALERSDHDVHVEYSTIFKTVFGKTLLKKELSEWRRRVRQSDAQLVSQRLSSKALTADMDEQQLTRHRLRQCFQIFDLDGSGALDLDEFQLMLSHLRRNERQQTAVKLTTAQTRDLFNQLDQDGNNRVTIDEFEQWWHSQHAKQQRDAGSSSASVSYLTTGLDRLVLTGHGVLFWLLGKKQQLERKFVKKMMVKRAMDSAKRALLAAWAKDEAEKHALVSTKHKAWRCAHCGRRFGLRRDLLEHALVTNCAGQAHDGWTVDTFAMQRWVREEELRLVDDEEEEADGGDDDEEGGDEDPEASRSEACAPVPP